MEDTAPSWVCNGHPKGEKAAVAVVSDSTPSPPTLKRELSCTAIPMIDDENGYAFLSTHAFATILDSGTTSHLIKDRGYFTDFKDEDHPPVKTASQGDLLTTGRGTCIIEITLGNSTHQVILQDCLHAPSATLNLLSVGRMLQKGWDCNFKGSTTTMGPHCSLSFKGEHLGTVPLSGNLFYLQVRFLHPSELINRMTVYKEICTHANTEMSAYTKTPITWDLWHARMGHPGGDAVKRLLLSATGVSIESNKPLSRCEACIVAKYPHKPYVSSTFPCVSKMLDLIHSDLCGPFPTQTPHGKLYFIVFLDDHTNLINVQLLRMKDQALEAWTVVKARWENHVERTVKVFCSDNGGEFMSNAFTKALQDAGIERQLSAPYAHQQNRKAECAICTLQGCALAMLEAAKLPPSLWGEAVLTAMYLWNRTESTTLPPGQTPFERLMVANPIFLTSGSSALSAGHIFPLNCKPSLVLMLAGLFFWAIPKA